MGHASQHFLTDRSDGLENPYCIRIWATHYSATPDAALDLKEESGKNVRDAEPQAARLAHIAPAPALLQHSLDGSLCSLCEIRQVDSIQSRHFTHFAVVVLLQRGVRTSAQRL